MHVDRVYTDAATIIDGLGHATWSATVPVSRSRTPSFQQNRHFFFERLFDAVGIAHKPHRCL